VLLTEFKAPTPSDKLRQRPSGDLQGLELPQIYFNAAERRPKYAMKPGLSATEKNDVVKAAYRQVFERDITRAYSLSVSDLESKVKNSEISMKEFVRRLAKSPLYRKNFYEPYINSRALELAFRHILGRAPSSREEVRTTSPSSPAVVSPPWSMPWWIRRNTPTTSGRNRALPARSGPRSPGMPQLGAAV
jgi:phycobilisome core-membrane linker protein